MPRWLAAVFPGLSEVDYIRAFQTSGGEGKEHTRPGRPFDQTVKDFCVDCNTGWMAQLESDAAPIMTPLIRGETGSLDALAQETLTIWATKTVLTAGPTNLGTGLFAAEETYRWFGANRAPIPGMIAWVGRYEGTGQWPVSFHIHRMAFGPADEQGQPAGEMFEGFHAVMAIGALVLCVFLIELPEPLASGGSDQQRSLIWPTSGAPVWWPPASSFATTEDLMVASSLTPNGPAAPLPPADSD